jgi:hypothetical protein
MMAAMLQAIVDDPPPGPSIVKEPPLEPGSSAGLTTVARKKLEQALRADYDEKNHGWETVQKFLDWDVIEFCIERTLAGDHEFERMARETLDAQLQSLIRPRCGFRLHRPALFGADLRWSENRILPRGQPASDSDQPAWRVVVRKRRFA